MVYLWHRKKDLSRQLTAPSSGAIDRPVDDTTDPAACASPEAATPPSLAAPTPAGAQTARPVMPIHGAFEDAQEQSARAIHRDVRTYGWAYDAGAS